MNIHAILSRATDKLNMVHIKPRGRPKKDEGSRIADRQMMIDAAVEILREGGAAAFNVRLVAERAGTAVGSVYTQFGSLEALRLEASAVTMRLLRNALAEALASCPSGAMDERLLCLTDAYLRFAAENRNAWTAMFEPRSIPAPPAIAADIAALFEIIEQELRDGGVPGEEDIPMLARALWSSVHGMVYLGEIGALGPIRPADIPPMVRALVNAAVRGLRTIGIDYRGSDKG